MKQMIRTLSLSLFVVTLFSACNSEVQQAGQTSNASDDSAKSISVEEAIAMTRSGVLMVDVREEEETTETKYAVSNIKYIPLSVIESNIGLIPKDEPVIVACRSGNRSQQAIDILSKSGYTNLLNMDGGMLAWQEADYPYYQGVNTGNDVQGANKSSSKTCCANPNSKNCNPDGTCKKGSENTKACCSSHSENDNTASAKKTCCANPNSKNCNPDGTCKKTTESTKACCSSKSKETNQTGKSCCAKK